MAAITVGFAEFEARLQGIRRRINRLALARICCSTGAVLLLAAAAVLAAEAGLSTQAAAWVRRGAAAAAVLVAAAAAWRLYAGWLDLAAAARHVDRSAGLEARVATMLAHPSGTGLTAGSPMRSILLWQIFDRAHLWEAERVAPRRLARPLGALAAALLVFASTVALLPAGDDDSVGDATTARQQDGDAAPADSPALLAAGDAGGRSGGTSRRGLGAGGSRLAAGQVGDGIGGDGVGGDSGVGEDGRGAPAGAADDAGEPGDPGNPGATSGADGGAGGAGGALDAAPGNLDDLERTGDVAGGPPGAVPQPLPGDPAPIEPPENAQGLPRLTRQARPGAESPGAAEKKSTADEAGLVDPNRPGNRAGGAKAGSDNPDRSGTAAAGLLGEGTATGNAAGDDDATEPMVIQLKAFAANPAVQYEPQGKPANDSNAASGAAPAPPAAIADLQAADSLLQRSVVTRAHQELIRELFTPDTGDQ